MSVRIVKFASPMLAFVTLFCIGLQGLVLNSNGPIPNLIEKGGITQGIENGTVIVYRAQTENPSDDDMESVVSTIRRRLDFQGYTEAIVARQGNDKVRVEVPDTEFSREMVGTLGAAAKLVFAETVTVDPNDADKIIVENIVMEGADVKDAVAEYNSLNQGLSGNDYFISLAFTDAGREKFAEATERLVGQPIYIVIDNEVISAPTVQCKIDSNYCTITGDFTDEAAKFLAANIKAGQIPFSLEPIEFYIR